MCFALNIALFSCPLSLREGSGLNFMLKSVFGDDSANSAGVSAAGTAWGDGDIVVAGQDRVSHQP